MDAKRDAVVGKVLDMEEDVIGKSHGFLYFETGREKAFEPPWIGGRCAFCREARTPPTEAGVTKLMLLSTSISAKRREDGRMVLAFLSKYLLGC